MASCGKVERLTQAYLDDELSSSERVVFEQHLAECSDCAARLNNFKQTSAALFEAFSESRLNHSLRNKVLAHLPEMEHQNEFHPSWQPQYKPIRFQWLRTLAPALAPILVLILGITLIYAWPSPDGNGETAIGMVTHISGDVSKYGVDTTEAHKVSLTTNVHPKEQFETGPDATLMVALAGPTYLKASPETKFHVLDDRKVHLEKGRIWFDVAKDTRTFLVETPSGEVTVYGTSFDVAVDDMLPDSKDSMVVTVASGEVQVGSSTNFQLVSPGQRIHVQKDSKELLTEKVDTTKEMAWAEDIQPSIAVAERFRKVSTVVDPKRNALLEQPLVITPDDTTQEGTSLVLTWQTETNSDHSGYYVYIRDFHSNAITREFIPGSTFNQGTTNSYYIKVPPVSTIGGMGYRIRCVPDRSGPNKVDFSAFLAQ